MQRAQARRRFLHKNKPRKEAEAGAVQSCFASRFWEGAPQNRMTAPRAGGFDDAADTEDAPNGGYYEKSIGIGTGRRDDPVSGGVRLLGFE